MPNRHKEQQDAAPHKQGKTSDAESQNKYLIEFADKVNGFVAAYHATHKGDIEHGKKSLFWTRWSAVFTGCAFLAAVIYAGIAYRQWRDASANFEVDQRAWVGVELAGTDGLEVSPDHQWFSFGTVTIKLHNTGKTPAVSSITYLRLNGDISSEPILDFDQVAAPVASEKRRKILESADSSSLEAAKKVTEILKAPYPEMITPGVVLAPGASLSQFIPGGSKEDKVLFPIKDHGVPYTLYILIKVTYNDIFAKSPVRVTKACLMHTDETEFAVCPSGNSMN